MDHLPLKAQSVIALVILLITVASGALMGCDDGVEGPEDVATAFLDDLRRGERASAMDAVWPPTRRELEAAHDDLADLFDGELTVDRSRMLVVTRLESPMLISRISTDDSVPEGPSDGDVVELTVEFRDDRDAKIPMRWGAEKQRWFVDLPVDERRPILVDDGIDEPSPEPEVDSEASEHESVSDENVTDE